MILSLLKITLTLGVFLIIRNTLMKEQTQFIQIRYFLLMGLCASACIIFAPSLLPTEYTTEIDLHDWTSEPVQDLSDSPAVRGALGIIPEKNTDTAVTVKNILLCIWLLGSIIMMFRFFRNVFKLLSRPLYYRSTYYKGMKVIQSASIHYPHSFFRRIFLPAGENDRRVWEHEWVHARRLHSIDRMLVELFAIVLWWNPIIHLYRNAIIMNHEFEADLSTAEAYGKAGYAELLLAYSSRKINLSISSPFPFFKLKKRLIMLSKSKNNPWVMTLSLAIAVGSILFLSSCLSDSSQVNEVELQEGFVVIIDAGHGGEDQGSEAKGRYEKEYVLDFSNDLIKAMRDAGIQTQATRNADQMVTLKDRAAQSETVEKGILLSIHLNAHEDPAVSGTEIFVNKDSNLAQVEALGKKLTDVTQAEIKISQAGFTLLKESSVPSFLIELGFITSDDDWEKLNDKEYRESMIQAMVDFAKSQQW